MEPSLTKAHECEPPVATSTYSPGQPAWMVTGPMLPVSLGVPDSSPVEGSRLSPSGSVPEAIDQVTPGALAVKVWV